MGEGMAWVALQHGRNRNERSLCEHSHCVPVRANRAPEAITAGSFCLLLAVQKYGGEILFEVSVTGSKRPVIIFLRDRHHRGRDAKNL